MDLLSWRLSCIAAFVRCHGDSFEISYFDGAKEETREKCKFRPIPAIDLPKIDPSSATQDLIYCSFDLDSVEIGDALGIFHLP